MRTGETARNRTRAGGDSPPSARRWSVSPACRAWHRVRVGGEEGGRGRNRAIGQRRERERERGLCDMRS